MNFVTTRCRWFLGILWSFGVLAVAAPVVSYADTLKDVMASKVMQKVELATERARKRRDANGHQEMSWFNGMDPQSNFALIWSSNGGPNLLFSWLGANLPQYKLVNTHGKRYRELVRAEGTLLNRDRVAVKIEIMIPHPTYRSMVQYKTLKQFNAFEPPVLRTVASEDIEANGRPAKYFRAERGFCSVLVKVAQLGVVNLSVTRCEQSHVMMDVANHLDYARLDKKLNS